jgi:hypothetical protein
MRGIAVFLRRRRVRAEPEHPMHIGALLRVWQRRQDLRDPRNGAYDKIVMRGGHDLVLANGYTNDTDTIQGGSGFDKINVADGDNFDKAGGGRGGDW